MVRARAEAQPPAWIDCAAESLVSSFANGIRMDVVAAHAIASPWSNGQTEGQVTRLKLVKRQMYGRAKLDLLEARLIGAACPLSCTESASDPTLQAFLHMSFARESSKMTFTS